MRLTKTAVSFNHLPTSETMYKSFSFNYLHIIFIVYFTEIYFCIVYAAKRRGDLKEQEHKTDNQINLIDELHSLYKDAVENEKTNVTRRFYAKDGHTKYTLHVQKLKEVNGVKTHNLRAEGRNKNEEPIIYINNPVEAGMPNPYLSINEFKKVMFERAQNQKKEFNVKINQPNNAYKSLKYKHFDIFNSVKKHVKEAEVRPKTEFPTKSSSSKSKKKTVHIINHKVHKKRKPKFYLSRATKSKTKPRIKTSTTLSEATVSDDFVIFDNNNINESITVTNEKKTNTTTESSVDEKKNMETTADAKITKDFVTAKGITTNSTADGETTTATVAFEDIITTEPKFGEEITTSTVALEDITTESTIHEKITTEMVTDEVTTETIADTTTETTVKTTRTRQARPYVFMGN